jgi:hypothetical protein
LIKRHREPRGDQRAGAADRRGRRHRLALLFSRADSPNTRSMRAVVVDSLAHSLVALLPAQAPEVLRSLAATVENWHGATEEDRVRALPFMFATFKVFENA